MRHKDAGSLERRIIATILSFSSKELKILEKAADGRLEGGDAISGLVLKKAVNLGLAYETTGRLKPGVYKMLQKGAGPESGKNN